MIRIIEITENKKAYLDLLNVNGIDYDDEKLRAESAEEVRQQWED